jgi:peptidylprolyl isomerase
VNRPRHLIVLLCAAPLAIAACGGNTKTAEIPSESAPAGDTTTAAQPEPVAKPAPASAAIKALAAQISNDTKKRPKIPKPKGKPPAELMVVDLVQGKGPAAKAGDQLQMDYSGTSWSTGKEFDSSWKSGQKFPLQLGAGGVIQGWEIGVPGMKQGGRRLLVIPPELGYGAQGSGGIAPNETLVFVVDARKLN